MNQIDAMKAQATNLQATQSAVYFHGDAARYTGVSEMLYGQMCYQIEMIEGHETGKLRWTYREPKQ